MQLKRLFADDDAVSPVIGVILMVAITVILAAVIGTFVLGLGKNVQKTSPTASVTFDQKTNADSETVVVVSHDGGDPLNHNNIDIIVEGDGAPNKDATDWKSDGDISAGDTVPLNDGDGLASNTVIKVVWTSDGGENSNVLAEYEVQ